MVIKETNEEVMERVRKSWGEHNNTKKLKERLNIQTQPFKTDQKIDLCHVEQPQPWPKPTETPTIETVNHPDHYLGTRKYEPIDVINDWELNFQTGNAVKYISRVGRKDDSKVIEDLKKAVWYLEWEIKRIESEKN